MRTKALFFVLITSILFVGCKTKSNSSFQSQILNSMTRSLNLEFNKTEDKTITWNTKDLGEIKFPAEQITIHINTLEETNNIHQFFKDQNWEEDLYNIADGVFAGLVGYKKNNQICTILSTKTDTENLNPLVDKIPENGWDIVISCGKMEQS